MTAPVSRTVVDALPSWQPFEWIVALRFLREGRIQTAFIINGIALGVAVIVFMSALLVGVQANFMQRVLTGQAHIQLLPAKEIVRPQQGKIAGPAATVLYDAIVQAPLQRLKSIDQWQSIAQQIGRMPEVLVVSPAATGAGLILRGDTSRAISIIGIKPELYFQIVPLADKIIRGNLRLTGADILIGSELAADLGVGTGDQLHVTAASGAATILRVTGIFDLGNKGANARTTFVALRTAQSLLGLVGGVSVLDVTVQDIYTAETIALRIRAATGTDAQSWIATNAQFFVAVGAQQSSNTVIRLFVALSVALGLLLWQQLQRNADGTPLFPLTFDPVLFISALGLSMLTGLVSAFIPALRASRLDPVVAIRG